MLSILRLRKKIRSRFVKKIIDRRESAIYWFVYSDQRKENRIRTRKQQQWVKRNQNNESEKKADFQFEKRVQGENLLKTNKIFHDLKAIRVSRSKKFMLKAVILIGSPQKGLIWFDIGFHCNSFYDRLGTRFRPLSLEIPKPLFPIAGFPILHHLIESCAQVIEFLVENQFEICSSFSYANFVKFFWSAVINRTILCHVSSPTPNKHFRFPFGTISFLFWFVVSIVFIRVQISSGIRVTGHWRRNLSFSWFN